MDLSKSIKKYRTEKNMTQKDLANILNVTPQAVSRWEAGEVEPSIDTLKQMATIFECSLDDLFGFDSKSKETPVVQTIVQEKIVYSQPKEIAGICDCCKKPYYDRQELVRINYVSHHRNGRSTITKDETTLLCKSCLKNKKQSIQKEIDNREEKRKHDIKVRRIHSFVWPTLILIGLLIGSIMAFVNKEQSTGVITLILGILLFFLTSVMIMNNTFIPDVCLEIASFGFVKMPGIIFGLSLDGIIWLITVKLLFAIISILLALASIVLAVVIAGGLSIFVYPLALYRSFNYINPNVEPEILSDYDSKILAV